jgi:hypothetical protein
MRILVASLLLFLMHFQIVIAQEEKKQSVRFKDPMLKIFKQKPDSIYTANSFYSVNAGPIANGTTYPYYAGRTSTNINLYADFTYGIEFWKWYMSTSVFYAPSNYGFSTYLAHKFEAGNNVALIYGFHFNFGVNVLKYKYFNTQTWSDATAYQVTPVSIFQIGFMQRIRLNNSLGLFFSERLGAGNMGFSRNNLNASSLTAGLYYYPNKRNVPRLFSPFATKGSPLIMYLGIGPQQSFKPAKLEFDPGSYRFDSGSNAYYQPTCLFILPEIGIMFLKRINIAYSGYYQNTKKNPSALIAGGGSVAMNDFILLKQAVSITARMNRGLNNLFYMLGVELGNHQVQFNSGLKALRSHTNPYVISLFEADSYYAGIKGVIRKKYNHFHFDIYFNQPVFGKTESVYAYEYHSSAAVYPQIDYYDEAHLSTSTPLVFQNQKLLQVGFQIGYNFNLIKPKL